MHLLKPYSVIYKSFLTQQPPFPFLYFVGKGRIKPLFLSAFDFSITDWQNFNESPFSTISAFELHRAAEAVFEQVDWQRMAKDVADNQKAKVYKKALKNALQENTDAPFAQENDEATKSGRTRGHSSHSISC